MNSAETRVKPIHVGFTNVYAIDTGEGLAIIDSGIPDDEMWGLLTRGLHAWGYDVSQVRWVLLTHHHFDHSGLAGRVKAASGAQVLIHEEDAPFLSQGGRNWRANFQNQHRLMGEHGVPRELLEWATSHRRHGGQQRNWRQAEPLFGRGPEHRVRMELLQASQDGAALEGAHDHAAEGGEHPHPASRQHSHEEGPPWVDTPLQADGTFHDQEPLILGKVRLVPFHTPGHTPGHACYYYPEEKVLFTGDHILKRITPNPGIYFLEDRYERRTRSLPNYIRSLQKVRDLPADRVLPAHEEPMDDLIKAADRILHHHDQRARKALTAIHRGRQTGFEVLPYVFPSLRAFALMPAMGELIGHLDLLEEQGQIRPEALDGQIVYRLAANSSREML